MSLAGVRVSSLVLATLLLIGLTTARSARTPADERRAAPEGLEQPPAPVPGQPPAGAAIHHGGGGVGFNAPRQELQLLVIKELLKVGDDDWKLIGPKVEKVIAAKQNMSTGAGMNWTTRHDAAPVFQASNAKPDTAPGRAMQAVRDAAADDDAPDEKLAKAMAGVRDARKQARVDHEAAQKQLIDAVTARQQAILMTLGVVE
jgi:hypothetical protein